MGAPLVAFLSDFGAEDWFVGVVHGVIHGICPEARVVDVTHAVPFGRVAHGAFLLEVAAPDFPPGTIHLVVVDPGVGTPRRALVVRAHGQLFVGPDNGVLEWAVSDPESRVHEVVEPRFQRQPVSRTFHARDVFGPAAAHLARGEPLESFGPRVTDPVRAAQPRARLVNGALVGQVMFVDRFGNAITNLTEAEWTAHGLATTPPEGALIEAGGRVIHGLARAYGDAPIGTLVAIIGSTGRLEIAQVGGDAAERLGLSIGDSVILRRA